MAPPSAIHVLPESDTSTYSIPDRLTLQGVAKRRAAAGKLVAGVAALADVEAFKGRTHHLHKPRAKRWDHRLSLESRSRLPSSLKDAAKYLKNDGMISLGGGLPSSEYFPFEELSVKVPGFLHTGVNTTHTLVAGKHDLALDKSPFDIATAFNYGQGYGAAQLLRWLIEHTEIVHSPPYRDWSCCMTIGSTSAIDIGLRMFCERGHWILSEEFTFPSAVEAAKPMGVSVVGVPMDEEGLLPGSLDHILSTWDVYTRGGPKPFVLYTVPTGQNPTGATASIQRRREIYAVAQKHDLIIFEDEPYYFLQMEPYTGPNASPVPPPASHEEFLSALVPSYLSIDVDGRVMRMDSFSKVISPGSRVGWITAPEQIVERYRSHVDVSTQCPSGMAQLILFKLLDEHWGHDGYLDWLMHIRMEYTERRNVLVDASEKYIPRDIVSWVPPMAGMFHWYKVDYRKHPSYPIKTRAEIEEEIFHAVVGHGTLLMKGSWFCPEGQGEDDEMFFRATYAAVPFEQIRDAVHRLGDAIRDTFGLPKPLDGFVQ